jgi:hypothetical protein
MDEMARSHTNGVISLLQRMLQGIAYRVAYENEFLSTKRLQEAALVVFARECILKSAAAEDWKVLPEARISALDWLKRPKNEYKNGRVDLAVAPRRRKLSEGRFEPIALFEFKRGYLFDRRICQDLQRLAHLKKSARRPCKAYLILVGSGFPAKLISESGRAIRRSKTLKDVSGKIGGAKLTIPRVCKALPTMKLRAKTGVWAIAIEVG